MLGTSARTVKEQAEYFAGERLRSGSQAATPSFPTHPEPGLKADIQLLLTQEARACPLADPERDHPWKFDSMQVNPLLFYVFGEPLIRLRPQRSSLV